MRKTSSRQHKNKKPRLDQPGHSASSFGKVNDLPWVRNAIVREYQEQVERLENLPDLGVKDWNNLTEGEANMLDTIKHELRLAAVRFFQLNQAAPPKPIQKALPELKSRRTFENAGEHTIKPQRSIEQILDELGF